MSPSTSIFVNGEELDAAGARTIADLLISLDIDPSQGKGIAVAVNDEVVRKSAWPERRLAPGDRVEVITARQGG